MARWENFAEEVKAFQFPSAAKSNDIVLPPTSEITINIETDIDTVMRSALLYNLNRVFRDVDLSCRFRSKAEAFSTPSAVPVAFVGIPDNVLLCNEGKVIEDKTPKDLDVKNRNTGQVCDLLAMYQEDVQYASSRYTRGNLGRMDVSVVIEQVYGYMALNNVGQAILYSNPFE